MFLDQRGQALHAFIGNIGYTVAELGGRGVQLASVPQDECLKS